MLSFRPYLLTCLFCAAAWLSAQTLTFSDPPPGISRSTAEVGVADFDGDGINDVAIANASQRWYKGPDFTTFYTIGTSDGGPYAARVADVNGDGFPDFVTSDGARNPTDWPGHIYLYLNPRGTGGDVTQPWSRITVYTGNVNHQNDMRLVDIDGDGRLDILEKTWSNDERVVIAFQNADINNWTVRTFDTGETGKPEGISAGDLDGDGNTEIVQSGVYWDCPGNWRTDAYVQYNIDLAFYASAFDKTKSEVGDIDGDGDNDVYLGSAEGADLKLAWYENTGLAPGGGLNWTEHVIRDDDGDFHGIALVDIDQDTDLDLVAGKGFGQTGCFVFYNNGDGTDWTTQNFDPDGNLYTLQVADLDADGDLDIIGPNGFNDPVKYYLNETEARVEPIVASPAGGNFVDPVTVSLSTLTTGAEIRYTLDGSSPTATSARYSTPLLLSETRHLRAVARMPPLLPSPLLDERYVIAENGNFPPVADAGPTQSQGNLNPIVLDGSGSSDLDDPVAGLSFSWRQISGPPVSLTTPTEVTAGFVPTEIGTYEFELTVSDELVSDKDTTEVRLTDLDANLVAYWPFDETDGSTAAELVAGKDASLTSGNGFSPGLNGNALSTDGSTGRAVAPAVDVAGEALTITAWIRAADLANVEGRIVSKAAGTSGNDHVWMLSQNGGSALRFRLNTGGPTTTLLSSTGEISVGEWIFVAGVYDGTEMRLYKNANLLANTPQTGAITQVPTVAVGIGNQPAGAGDRPFSGLIDEVRIYAAALTAAELNDLYQATIALPVRWRSFTARKEGKTAVLHWETATESDNAGFAVERLNGGDFREIGFVPAGTGTYFFVDETPPVGQNFYRLRQRDLDGTESLSPTVSLTFRADLWLYPVPAHTWFTLETAAGATYVVRDASGRLVTRGKITGARTRVPCADWHSGRYTVELLAADGTLLGVGQMVR